MTGEFLPDYGLALLEDQAKQPVELNPLFVEDVGRLDEDRYTMSGKRSMLVSPAPVPMTSAESRN